jgi:iron complex outermembrane receptor protein
LIGLDEKSKSYSVQSDLYLAHRISKHWNNSYRLNYNYTEAYTDAYKEKQNIQALNLILKSSFETEKLYAALSNRSSLYIDELNFFLPALDVKFKFYKNISAIMDVSRVYRNPTLNDRFWQPGGNINIKTESGWNNSAGIEISNKKERWIYKLQAAYFYTLMNNEIVWTPSDLGLYTAQNVNQSISNGIRAFANISRQWKKSAINLWMNASYGNYLVKQSATSDKFKNKVYTPHEIYKWGITYNYQKLQLNYYGSYSGYTFVTIDNSSWRNPFLLHDISLSYSMEIKNSMLQFYVGSKNMLDANYQIVKYRPMPGRSYQVGMHVILK